MTEVTPRFKEPKPAPLERAWNSTLPRASKNLKSSGQSIKARSAKASKDDRTFKAGTRSVLCQRCAVKPAVDGSHRGTRAQRPDLRGDPGNRDDLCRECHEWVEAHPIEAKAEGWRLEESYELANRDPMAKVLRKLKKAS